MEGNPWFICTTSPEEYKPILERYSTVSSLDFKSGTGEINEEVEIKLL